MDRPTSLSRPWPQAFCIPCYQPGIRTDCRKALNDRLLTGFTNCNGFMRLPQHSGTACHLVAMNKGTVLLTLGTTCSVNTLSVVSVVLLRDVTDSKIRAEAAAACFGQHHHQHVHAKLRSAGAGMSNAAPLQLGPTLNNTLLLLGLSTCVGRKR